MNKNVKVSFQGIVDNFHVKSKLKFIYNFICIFPQFAPQMESILKSVKESSSEEEIKTLEMKEIEIYEFQLNQNNHALIGYLQRNMP